MKILEDCLDPEQLTIAKDSGRSLLVIAGPGSGKTHLLTHVAAYQVRRSHPANWRVLCLTFSVEAASQMHQRLMDPGLCVPRRRVEVANFHQLGARLLRSHGHHVGWPRDAPILGMPDAEDIAKEVATELRLPGLSGKAAHEAISRLRNHREPAAFASSASSLQALRTAYEERLEKLRVRDFDDLILHSVRLLREQPEVTRIVRQAYRYVLVDELQDTSGWQMEFISELTQEGTTSIFAVADNDQMIYGWRDARAENIDEWEGRFSAERRLLLGNYRCPPRIVSLANDVIVHNQPGVDEAKLPYSRVERREGVVRVVHVPSEHDEGVAIAAIVEERLAAGVPKPAVAILASVWFILDPALNGLDALGIPVERVGDDYAASPFARLLCAALTLSAMPTHARSRTKVIGAISATVPEDAVGEALETIASQRTVGSLIRQLTHMVGLALDDPDVDRARRVVAMAEREYGVEPPALVGQRLPLEWNRLGRRLQRESDSVKVMTTFGAKGLEFDTVILPGFNDRLVPYVRQGDKLTAEWWAAKRRELYVAITRAQDRLYIMQRDDRAASPFLAELDIDTDEHVGRPW